MTKQNVFTEVELGTCRRLTGRIPLGDPLGGHKQGRTSSPALSQPKWSQEKSQASRSDVPRSY
eukprot:9104602-Pyramimonas_sp.AAC.1